MDSFQKKQKRGFTLVELLVVIGILVVLSTATLIVLNPVELFRQARDSQRFTDLTNIGNALSFYLSTASTTDLDGTYVGCSSLCFTYVAETAASCGGRHPGKTSTVIPLRSVNGAGWIPVRFIDSSGGSPISALPIDPVNDTTYFYSYACDNTEKTFELDADIESNRYKTGGDQDKETGDGGNSVSYYEVGTDADLDL
ncbi:MAG: type II secretion system protein [Candidatus Pacebacteria bacterium]|nr:type II secretion system protein [Candidatus Paceibacterota bacterium]